MYKFWSLILFSIGMFITGFTFLFNDILIFMDWEIISVNSVSLVMTFLFDWMSLIFIGCVLFISSMVIFFMVDHM